jgi:hypothetical protein
MVLSYSLSLAVSNAEATKAKNEKSFRESRSGHSRASLDAQS